MTVSRKRVTSRSLPLDTDAVEIQTMMAAGQRRPALNRALTRPSPAVWALLNATAADGPHGCALASRLWPAPDEMWLGWRPGFGKAVVKIQAHDRPLVVPPDLPGLPPVLESGANWVVRVWVGGRSLARALRDPLPASAAWATLEALEETVELMHRAGHAHGAICPENVILPTGQSRPVLIDWGLSPLAAQAWGDGANPFRRDRHALARLTALVLHGVG